MDVARLVGSKWAVSDERQGGRALCGRVYETASSQGSHGVFETGSGERNGETGSAKWGEQSAMLANLVQARLICTVLFSSLGSRSTDGCFLGLGFTVFTVPTASKQGLRPCTPAPAAGFRLRRAMLDPACGVLFFPEDLTNSGKEQKSKKTNPPTEKKRNRKKRKE